MTKKKLRQRMARAVRRATGLRLPEAASIARVVLRDGFEYALSGLAHHETLRRHIGGGWYDCCGMGCTDWEDRTIVGPRGEMTSDQWALALANVKRRNFNANPNRRPAPATVIGSAVEVSADALHYLKIAGCL